MKSPQGLLQYFVYILSILGCNCRKANKDSRITNGTKTLIGHFPFVASVIFYGGHKCGASIISKEWVLTAAHCCFFNKKLVPNSAIQISVGSVYWRDGNHHRVSRKIYHESYDAVKANNDIALMRVRTPFIFGPTVNLIKLSAAAINEESNNLTAIVIGWGLYLNHKGVLMSSASEQLQHVVVKIIRWNICKKYYDDISPSNICVFTGSGKGSCRGDSGGPLVMQTTSLLIGVVSYGADCTNNVPEVYTRVSAFYSWIKSQIRKKINSRDNDY